MLNPRLPFLAGGIAVLAVALTQELGGSSVAGFLFGWLVLATLLTLAPHLRCAAGAGVAQRIAPLAQREIAKFVRTYAERARLKVVARTRRGATAPSLGDVPPYGVPPFRV